MGKRAHESSQWILEGKLFRELGCTLLLGRCAKQSCWTPKGAKRYELRRHDFSSCYLVPCAVEQLLARIISRLVSSDLLIPEAVIGTRPSARDASVDHSVKRFRLHEDTHVNMNYTPSEGGHRRGHVYGHRQITQPAQTPRNVLHEPQADSGNHQQNYTAKHQPEEQLLAEIEAAHRWQLLILIFDVVIYRLRPAPVRVGRSQVAAPHHVHPNHRHGKRQAKPGMPESRRRTAAHQRRQPVHIRRPES